MRHLADLTDDEWEDLMQDFADVVLTRHRVIGSVAGDYSLYAALEQERAGLNRDAGLNAPRMRRERRESSKPSRQDGPGRAISG